MVKFNIIMFLLRYEFVIAVIVAIGTFFFSNVLVMSEQFLVAAWCSMVSFKVLQYHCFNA